MVLLNEADGVAHLGQVISEHTGIDLGPEVLVALERKVQPRIRANALQTVGEYARLLATLPEGHPELQIAVDLATIKETYFLREEQQIAAWIKYVFEPGAAKHPVSRGTHTTRRFTIWSAGCATGEEVYSLALLLCEAKLTESFDFRIIGTDVSRKAIETARKGVYSQSAFRVMSPELQAKYFLDTMYGASVSPELRTSCRFFCGNMLIPGTALFGPVDTIFCRNVLIYFGERARKQVLDRFYERLNPGGILCLGHSESLLHTQTPFVPISTSGGILYMKRDSRFPRGGTR